MTPEEIKSTRQSLYMSLTDMARALGFNGKHAKKTVWRWEHGLAKPGPSSLILLKMLGNNEIPRTKQNPCKIG